MAILITKAKFLGFASSRKIVDFTSFTKQKLLAQKKIPYKEDFSKKAS
jgi:hypothetical protein